jgi:hypothetical protein
LHWWSYQFTDTTVLRLIQDTTAKGLYRSNHTYRDGQGKLIPKPESEWVFSPVEPIVPEALKECNDALGARKAQRPLGPCQPFPFRCFGSNHLIPRD